jgi:hypothetical protein
MSAKSQNPTFFTARAMSALGQKQTSGKRAYQPVTPPRAAGCAMAGLSRAELLSTPPVRESVYATRGHIRGNHGRRRDWQSESGQSAQHEARTNAN